MIRFERYLRRVFQHYGKLPKSLRDILTKDRDAVLQRRLLTKLPAVYPIDVLLHEVSVTLCLHSSII